MPLATRSTTLSNASNMPARSTSTKPFASGGGMAAVRSRVSGNVSTTPASCTAFRSSHAGPTTSVDTLSRSAGAISRNSPGDSAPTIPTAPNTQNPRSNAASGATRRELFPDSSANPLNQTAPLAAAGSVSRSSTFSRTTYGGIHTRFGSALSTMPTTNMSLDSATFGSLLHNRESKFLIPAFRAPSRPPATMTPDAYSVAARADEPDSVTVETPTSVHAPRTPTSNYYTIVFDLDETLVSNRGPGRAILRPGCMDLLKSLRALSTPERPIEIVLWTASVESLARTVLLRLDPENSIFTDLIFRDSRWFKETGYTKDLRLLGRDMERVVIIENSPMSVTLNRAQSILVKDFMGHAPHDTDLKAVKEVLEGWVTADAFVPIRQWLAQHPRIDRSNNIIAAPALNSIVNSHKPPVAACVGGASPLGTGRRALGGPRPGMPLYSRRW